jgi:hypothetical protein
VYVQFAYQPRVLWRHTIKGNDYRVLLTVEQIGSSYLANLFVDDVRVGLGQAMLQGHGGTALEDCGAPSTNCVMKVGQKSVKSGLGGAFTGIVYDARAFFGTALIQYPL